MIALPKFFLFLTAAVLLAIAPGPGMLYVLARSLAGGKREGVLSAFGTFLGGMLHVFAAALGISLILAKSAVAFAVVKYVGAAYLCLLGVRMILDAYKQDAHKEDAHKEDAQQTEELHPDEVIEEAQEPATVTVFKARIPRSANNPLWQGVATEALNPKTALFFLSFIPQFVNRTSGHIFLQFILLGTLSVCMNTSADLIVIAMAGPLGRRIRSSASFRRRQRTVTGAIMIGLGTYLATSNGK